MRWNRAVVMTLAIFTACAKKAPESIGTQGHGAGRDGVVEVTTAGAEPRQMLALALEPGQTFADLYMMDISTHMNVFGMDQTLTLPTTTMRLETTVESADATGYDLRSRYVSVDFEQSDSTDAMMVAAQGAAQEAYAGLVGLEVVTHLTPQGRTTDVDMVGEVPDALREMATSMFQQDRMLAISYPTVPVGPGAQWTVGFDMPLQGLPARFDAAYVLDGFEDGKALISVSTTMGLGQGDMVMEGMPEGVEMNIGRLDGQGSGALTFDPRRPMPQARIESSVSAEMTAGVEGQEMQMTMEMTMGMEIVPAEL